MKKLIALFLSVLMVVGLVACQPKAETSDKQTSASSDNKLAGKKVALIIQASLGTFTTQYIAGVKEQTEKLGGSTTVFTSDGDLAKMASNLDAAINQKFDAILIDHGTAEALNEGVKKAKEANIAVVVFDSDVDVAGVPVLEQGDQKMATMTLEKLAKDFDDKAKIVRIWVAGFAPMERRKEAYDAFMKDNKGIEEIATFGSVTSNTALDTQSQMEAVLKQYPNKGDIDAIWAPFDEFAKGAVRALEQAGRTDIKVYGIDMSDEDLQMMQSKNSPWVASAAVDPTDIGRIQVRYAYQQLLGAKVEEQVVLTPVFVDQASLPKDKVTTADLSQYIDGWGASDQGYTDELRALEK
jgi:simple sugar transport system substrate-binding protein